MIICNLCQLPCWFDTANDLAFCVNPKCQEFDREIIQAAIVDRPIIGLSLRTYLRLHNRLDEVVDAIGGRPWLDQEQAKADAVRHKAFRAERKTDEY